MIRQILSRWARPAALLITLVWIIACAVNPVTGKRELMLISESQEIALGKESDPQIVATYGVYDFPRAQNFISDVGRRMVQVSHRQNISYEFKLMDTPVINAFAVPGGYVYITRGILAYLNSEAEFAGVMGHEIGHVTARHSAKQVSKSQIAQIGLGVGSVLSESFARFAGAASTGLQLLFLKNGRDAERESDRLGVEYATKIGFDARQMANFFVTLDRMTANSEAGALPSFLSTHPSSAERVQNIGVLAAEWQAKVPNSNYKINRNEFLNNIDGIVFGDDPQQGYQENNIFYHPQMRFQFPVPTAWRLANTPSQVQMANEQGTAVMVMTLASGTTPAAASQNFHSQNQTVVESQNSVTVNGLGAHRSIATLATEQGTLKILSYFISYGGNVYTFHGYTDAASFASQLATFEATMKGFKELTDSSKINVRPDRVRIKTVNRAATLRDALKTLGMPDDKLDELALMNGMNLTDRVAQGTLIKTIGK